MSFARKIKRDNAKKAVMEIRSEHKGQKFNKAKSTWEDVQTPFIKEKESLQKYQAKNIKKRLEKVGK